MFIRKKRNASGSISVQIIEKIGRNNKVVQTIGSSKDEIEIELLYEEGLKLIPQLTKQPILNLFPNDKTSLLKFGLVVTKYLKSNCIGIFSEKNGGLAVITSGVGQPNRLDCITRLIATRLKDKNTEISNAILISDAFFPFKDSIEAANELGVKFIAQPGGSIRDPEVIEACDQYGISMVMTGKRHFRH